MQTRDFEPTAKVSKPNGNFTQSMFGLWKQLYNKVITVSQILSPKIKHLFPSKHVVQRLFHLEPAVAVIRDLYI